MNSRIRVASTPLTRTSDDTFESKLAAADCLGGRGRLLPLLKPHSSTDDVAAVFTKADQDSDKNDPAVIVGSSCETTKNKKKADCHEYSRDLHTISEELERVAAPRVIDASLRQVSTSSSCSSTSRHCRSNAMIDFGDVFIEEEEEEKEGPLFWGRGNESSLSSSGQGRDNNTHHQRHGSETPESGRYDLPSKAHFQSHTAWF